VVQKASADILMNLLKGGKEAKLEAVKWMAMSILLNVEAEKGRPSPLISSSSGFAVNLGVGKYVYTYISLNLYMFLFSVCM
jgi:hypothetical protein